MGAPPCFPYLDMLSHCDRIFYLSACSKLHAGHVASLRELSTHSHQVPRIIILAHTCILSSLTHAHNVASVGLWILWIRYIHRLYTLQSLLIGLYRCQVFISDVYVAMLWLCGETKFFTQYIVMGICLSRKESVTISSHMLPAVFIHG